MILRKAGEHSGQVSSTIDGGALATKLVQYASLLASQGCLETALHFLGETSNDPSISSLRERLYLSLRQTSARPTRAQINPRSRQSSESRSSVGRKPSYPIQPALINPLMKRNSSDYLDSTDFSNLTGPVHPTAPPSGYYGGNSAPANPYGNLYVNNPSTGPVGNPPSMHSPALSSGASSYGVGSIGRPPSTTPGGYPGIYNPLGNSNYSSNFLIN